MKHFMRRMPTPLLLALALVAGVFMTVALGHDPVQEAGEAITDLRARADVAASQIQSQGELVQDLYLLVDSLKARADELLSRLSNLDHSIGVAFEEIDEVKAALGVAVDDEPEVE